MATIYRFVIEQKTSGGGSSGRKSTEDSGIDKKTPSKKGKLVSLLGGERGGVEHNRKTRAINPLLNKITGGYWEKGMRLGRAGLGLLQFDSETGKFAGFSGVSVAIIFALVIQVAIKIWQQQRQLADQQNKQNYKMLENGVGAIRGEYETSVNVMTGRITYNQNK